MEGLTEGRIVHYVLTGNDADRINRRRVANASHAKDWPSGAQAHIGNPVFGGEHIPMIVTQVWPNEFGPDYDGVNGKVFLDGNDTYWVTSIQYSENPNEGTWHWIERA